MLVEHTALAEVRLLTPAIHHDERGYFLEHVNRARLQQALALPELEFVQENLSHSTHGVLRGLHFQRAPYAQGKLVSVVAGAIFDVAVDIRPDSPQFGQWAGALLTAENRRQLWVPPGHAHGFLVLSESADCLYQTTAYWQRDAEGFLRWDDPAIGIDWPLAQLRHAPLLAPRDRDAERLEALKTSA